MFKKPYFAPELDVDVYLFTATEKKVRIHDGEDTLGWERVVKARLAHNFLSGNHQNHFKGENAQEIVDIFLKAYKQCE